MKDLLETLIARFNDRALRDERMKEELAGLDRRIQIATEEAAYHLHLQDGQLSDLEEGEIEGAEVTIRADAETLRGVLSGEIAPFKAIALKRLKIQASFEDALRLRKLLS